MYRKSLFPALFQSWCFCLKKKQLALFENTVGSFFANHDRYCAVFSQSGKTSLEAEALCKIQDKIKDKTK